MSWWLSQFHTKKSLNLSKLIIPYGIENLAVRMVFKNAKSLKGSLSTVCCVPS